MTGAITTNSTFDGRDVAADGVLATNALPKAGGTVTGTIIGSRFEGATDSADPWLKGKLANGTETSYIKKDGQAYFASRVMIGTTTEGSVGADGLTVAASGSTGITIRAGASSSSSIYMSDATSGSGEYAGYLAYSHSSNTMSFATASTPRLTLTGSGNVGIGISDPTFSNNYKGLEIGGYSNVVMKVSCTVASGWAYSEYAVNDTTKFITGLQGNVNAYRIAYGTNIQNDAKFSVMSDGKCGIGTITPDSPLEVVGANSGIKISSGSSDRPMLQFESGGVEKLTLSSNTSYGAIGDSTNANRYMVFKDGNVGIGITDPAHGIQTKNFRGTGSAPSFSGTSGDGFAFDYYNGGNPYPRHGAIAVIGSGTSTADLSFWTDSGSNVVERMVIESTGGIRLTGLGTVRAVEISVGYDSNYAIRGAIHWRDSSNITGAIDTRYNGTTVDMHFGSLYNSAYNATSRMVLKGNGSLLVGKTAVSDTTAGFQITSGGNVVTVSNGSGFTYQVNDGSAFKWRVNANGGIYNFQSNNVNLSDQREKKNIEALGAQWDAVKAWSVKEFHYNEDEDSDAKKVGVIAQDVETNHPNLVTDFELSEDKTRKAVKEQQLMWLAIKALQEAQARIETLETKVAVLEG